MKSSFATTAILALAAAALVSHAQHHLRPADKLGALTLLPGPHFLSPADATGEVVPGQLWTLKKTPPQFVRPQGKLILGTSAGSWAIRSEKDNSAPKFAVGTLTFRAVSGTLQEENKNFVRELKSLPALVPPESLRFDAKWPETKIPPLKKM
jgi:hypothetical protein